MLLPFLTNVENILSKRTYFSGDRFSTADTIMIIILEMTESLGLVENRTIAQAYQKSASFG
ncbi:glutathione binding-like protein [Colwellia sp. C1TZA3]|uniref:glutathione binding-like protein n=1 Tax=Colwellia sp. C1TZA3 TaxID=2508879 RepID=UPI0011B9D345|nr:glutathione binding-like protein [Colwellia sp. C1TZA3]TWX71352.1 hypothetical protein ESZ39_09535 [Colwellia sp. C1TZA3]